MKDILRPGLLIYHPPTSQECRYLLSKHTFTLGRSPECDVAISHPYISRLHAAIVCRYNRYHVADAGSTNGTLVNGQYIAQEVVLAHSDEICLGSPEVKLTFADPSATTTIERATSAALVVAEETYSIYAHGTALKLSPLEYQLLAFLAEHAGAVCTREQCFQAAWGTPYDHATCEDALNACITKLRRHLRSAAEAAGVASIQISVVQRVGFRLDTEAYRIRREEQPLLQARQLGA